MSDWGFIRLSVAARGAMLALRGFADSFLEMGADIGDATYNGPCVCDVCPCPLKLVHSSGTSHCWLCERGDHWPVGA